MKKPSVFRFMAIAVMLLIMSCGIALADFTAYNDGSWDDVQIKDTNKVNYYSILSDYSVSTGLLKDYTTGANTGVTVTVSGTVMNNDEGLGTSCAVGTDASNVFDGKVDLRGCYYAENGNPETMTLTFTGMDPNATYEFVTTANRAGGASYTTRTTTFTLGSVDAYTNNSSTGAVISGLSTTIISGENTANGYVARWTGIKCGSDGTITISAAKGDGNTNKAYMFSAFMLKETGGQIQIPQPDPEPKNYPAKDVILMIGDGMGFKHVEATRNYVGHQLNMETLPVHLACSTFPYGGSYNPALASTSFDYLNNGFTDSAAAATALSTGNKTSNGRLAINYNATSRLTSITEHVRNFSKAIGAITTVPFSHATPAGFMSHNSDRGNTAAIAREMIMGIGDGAGAWGNTPTADVIIGGGQNTGYIATNEYNALKNRTTGQGWTFVERTTGVNGGNALLNASQNATKLFGLFGGGTDGDFPTRLANGSGFNPENPTLAQMSQAALTVLNKNPNGFFLMVEGGAIDHGSHNNNIDVMIGEAIDFDNAVGAVINWINANDPTWSNTLLVVTADHETGYITKATGTLPNVPLGNPGAGVLPTAGVQFAWNSGNHTNSPVPVFAKGVGTETLQFYATKHDSLYNIDYLDDTDIFRTICRGLTNPATLAGARSSQDNDKLSIYNAIVTVSYDDAFWVEKADRSAGIKVISTVKPEKGKKVDVIGRIVRQNGEIAIQATSVNDAGVATVPDPMVITGRTASELDKTGAAAQGMFVKMAGKVSAVTKDASQKVNGYFLDDGAGLAGDGTNKGLYVVLDPIANAPESIVGTLMVEKGPLTTATVNGDHIPAIRGEIKEPTEFTAYNDCSVAGGDPTANITTYTLGANAVALKDFVTGRDLSVKVTMTTYSNFTVNTGTGGTCSTGTDATNVFGGKVGLTGVINYSVAAAASMELVVSGLDPNGRYEFVTTANRASSTYTTRTTKFSILDATSFTNSSTLGATFTGVSDPTVTFCTGYNTVKGYVARWTNIKPSAGGTFRIKAENPTGVTQTYGLSGFMLRRTQ